MLAGVRGESVTDKLMDERAVLNQVSTWALRDLRRIYCIPALLGAAIPVRYKASYYPYTAFRATTERDMNVKTKTSHWSKWIVTFVKVLLLLGTTEQMYRASLKCNTFYTRLKRNVHLGYNETNCICSKHIVSGEERTYCLRKWCKCAGINEVTIMTSLPN